MNKRIISLLIALILMFSFSPVLAANQFTNDKNISQNDINPVIYEKNITVTEEGGKFDIGFVTISFPKDFIDSDRLPRTFNIQVFSDNGVAGVQINPSTSDFNKTVRINVESYEGLLYDKTLGKNVAVDIKNQVIFAEHFSWFRFR